MNELFSSPLIVSVASGLLALLSAAFGFMYRALREHSKPAVRILGFDNTYTTSSEPVVPAQEVLDLLKSIQTGAFAEEEETAISLPDLKSRHAILKGWETGTEPFIEAIDAYIHLIENNSLSDGDNSESALKALRSIIAHGMFDGTLVTIVGRSLIEIPPPKSDINEVVSVVRGQGLGGCYVAYVPDPITIGRKLNERPEDEHYFMKFSGLLARAEHRKMGKVFAKVAELLRRDLPKIKDSAKLVGNIVGEHTVYTIRLYVANLTRTPILIEPKGELLVDGAEAGIRSLKTEIRLARKTKRSGEVNLVAVEDAIVLPSGEDDQLVAFTRATKKIKEGKILDVAFSQRMAKARVVVSAEMIGFPKQRRLATAWRSFESDDAGSGPVQT